ncbi:MAG: glycoside hydrolase domain-containing protein [Planctomycetota bacterium]
MGRFIFRCLILAACGLMAGCYKPEVGFNPVPSTVRVGGPTGVGLPGLGDSVTLERAAGEWTTAQVALDLWLPPVPPGESPSTDVITGRILLRWQRPDGTYAAAGAAGSGEIPRLYQVLPVNYRGPAFDRLFHVPSGDEGSIPDACVPIEAKPGAKEAELPLPNATPEGAASVTLLAEFPPGDGDETWVLSVEYGAGEYSFTVHLKTYPVRLPTRFDFMTATTWDWQIEKYLGRELTAEERATFIDFFLDYHFTPAAFFGQGPGFSAEEIKHIVARGGTMFQVFHIGGGGKRVLSTAQKKKLKPQLKAWRETMNAAGAGNMCYALVADEPAADADADIRANATWLKSVWPELHIWVGTRPRKDLMDGVDAWDCITAASTDYYKPHEHTAEAYALARAAPNRPQYWWFWSVEPYPPHLNCLIEDPLIDCRAIGWKSFVQGVDGFEYFWATDWAANRDLATIPYPAKAWRWNLGLSGAGQLCYPINRDGKLEPIPSLRLVNLRAGFQDWELFRMVGAGLKARFPHPDLQDSATLEAMHHAALEMLQARAEK